MSLDHRDLEQLDDLRAGLDTASREGIVFTDAQDIHMWSGSVIHYVSSPGTLHNPYEHYFRHLDPNNIEYYTTPHNVSILQGTYSSDPVYFDDLNYPSRSPPQPIPFTDRPTPSTDRIVYSRPVQGKLSMMQRLKGLFENITIQWARRR